MEIKEYTLYRDNERDIKFTGYEVAEVSSHPDRARSDYSGTTGRWTILTLYKTESGKWVCWQIGKTQWQGEKDRYSGCVRETDNGVIDFFGQGWLAKELYEAAGIDNSERVD